jgi:hypothetical protein
MNTIIKSASVKIMLSYDYSHFETSMSLDNEAGLSNKDIDDARKECQRLCDKAVNQFKIAKLVTARREKYGYAKDRFISLCNRIDKKPESERSPEQIAILKQRADEAFQRRFDVDDYDYEDDYEMPDEDDHDEEDLGF